MRNEIITLITDKGKTYDESGFPAAETEETLDVFAMVKSVRASEYYEAMRSNLKLAYIFAVDPDDYNTMILTVSGKKVQPSLVSYDGDRYRIIRTYRTDMGDLELSCERVE